MSAPRMHDDEVDTDADLVGRLLASQHPQWADLPLERVWSTGTDNAMYRLGDGSAARSSPPFANDSETALLTH